MNLALVVVERFHFLEALRIPVINISSYVFSKGVLGQPIVGSLKFQKFTVKRSTSAISNLIEFTNEV